MTNVTVSYLLCMLGDHSNKCRVEWINSNLQGFTAFLIESLHLVVLVECSHGTLFGISNLDQYNNTL